MSHDFALWDTDTPLEDDEAGLIYCSLVDTGSSDKVRPSAKIAELVKELQAHWPDPAPGCEDDWPLAVPLESNGSWLIVCIVPSRLWDVWPVLGELAKQKELVMYDPQQQCVFLPRRLSQKRTRLRAKRKQEPEG